ncbi:hypothetical protein ABEF95_009183 [Exophiala dermatitidis]
MPQRPVSSLLGLSNTSSNSQNLGQAYLILNLTTGSQAQWAKQLPSDQNALDHPPEGYRDRDEWVDILYSSGTLALSITLCYTSFATANLPVLMSSNMNRTEPIPPYEKSTSSYKYDNVRMQLGQNNNTVHSLPTPEERGVLTLSSQHSTSISLEMSTTRTASLAKAPSTVFLFDGKALDQPGGNTLQADSTLVTLFQEIVTGSGGSVAFALQSLYTVMAANVYYLKLPEFDARSVVQRADLKIVNRPMQAWGFFVMLGMVICHFIMIGIVLWFFFRQTRYTYLGEAWMMVAQTAGGALLEEEILGEVKRHGGVITGTHIDEILKRKGVGNMHVRLQQRPEGNLAGDELTVPTRPDHAKASSGPEIDGLCLSHTNSVDIACARMLANETVLEAPVTPAPVFAYRALKGVFISSPDSSPDHDNKENVHPDIKTLPTKMDSSVNNGQQRLQLTPSHKRKWDNVRSGTVMSPTKGILRTPGLVTPRTKALKELNVKFKSVSPEVVEQHKNVATTLPEAGPGDHMRRVSQDGFSSGRGARHAMKPSKFMDNIPDSQPTVGKRSVRSSSQQKQLAKTTEPTARSASSTSTTTAETLLSPEAIQAYMQQTEKEMKRLLRYNQKMREYARKKDAENQELQAMIEQLRKENERFRSGLIPGAQCREDHVGFAGAEVSRSQGTDGGHTTIGKSTRSNPTAPTQSRQPYSPFQPSKNPGPVELRENMDTVLGKSDNVLATVGMASATKNTDLSFGVRAPPATITAQGKVSLAGAESKAGAPSGPEARLGVSTRLPPDRLAAARERLRQRAEARKISACVTNASVENFSSCRDEADEGSGALGPKQDYYHERIRNESHNRNQKQHQTQISTHLDAHSRDQSQVDWLDL